MTSSPAAADSAPIARGSKVGRYVVLEPIGAGAMGVVFSAYDPELDRKVALKLMRTELAEARTGSIAHARMLREAQAMAKLSHPNVVTVHDVGTYGTQVFIAMEHVDGETLDEWRERARPTWEEILDVYCRAGHGLAAAHAANLIHRDFKPTNVLLGKDGRVRVTDFGIAGHAVEDGAAQPAPSGSGLIPARRQTGDGALTQTGAMIGTPYYAAPEQLTGGAADPRSDQFSFCVALWEALYGERPFPGDTLFELLAAIEEQAARPAPTDSPVPASVRQILLLGLSARPDERYPTMATMLALLQAAPQSQLAGIWDATSKADYERAFLAINKPFARGTWSTVAQLLDRYAEAWLTWRRDAWEATHLRHEQSEEVLDLRMRFLDQRLEELRALCRLFARADATVVQAAVEAVHGLTDPAGCADLPALRSMLPPPRDAATRQRIATVREKLAEAQALVSSNKLAAAESLAIDAVNDAGAVDYPPLHAEALGVLGDVERRLENLEAAESTLVRAAVLAESCRHDRVKAKAFIDLVYVTGYRMAAHREGHTWGRLAAAAIDRLGGDDVLKARLLNNIGGVLWSQGEYDKALESNRRALALRERALGTDHPAVADSLNNLGVVCWRMKDHEQAVAHYRRALEIFERALGPEHPNVAASLNNLAAVLKELGRDAEAAAHYERSLALLLAALGEEHERLQATQKGLGMTYASMGQHEKAIPLLERALSSSSTPSNTGALAFALARSLWDGRHDRAVATHLAEQARRAFAKLGAKGAAELQRLDTWLASLGS
jgi:tetratricopeptide (TPR) repeat protein